MNSLRVLAASSLALALVIGCGGRANDDRIDQNDSNVSGQKNDAGGNGGGGSNGGGGGGGGGGKNCASFSCAPGTALVCDAPDCCQGHCEPVACPPYVPTCAAGEEPADTNGDGCVDGCKKKSCAGPPPCAYGMEPADYDGDGCFEGCKPKSCPPVALMCNPGEVPADTNGDTCVDTCVACPAILCAAGTQPVDTNGDGCLDACK